MENGPSRDLAEFTPNDFAGKVVSDRGDLQRLTHRALGHSQNARAESTVRAYRSDWRDFTEWTTKHELGSLPADPLTVALYIEDIAGDAGAKANTIERRLSAIAYAHKLKELPDPTKSPIVSSTWAGLKREIGTKERKALPIETPMLREMLAAVPPGLSGTRDCALLLGGFVGAFRRSELVALDGEDVSVRPEGIVLTVRRSKTDQEGAGAEVGLPYGEHRLTCPVRSLEAWMQEARISTGPLFRRIDRHGNVGGRLSPASVDAVVKKYARATGYLKDGDRDPSAPTYSAHSLRAGFVTSAAKAGVPEWIIQRQTRHKDLATLRGYIRAGDVLTENAARSLGL